MGRAVGPIVDRILDVPVTRFAGSLLDILDNVEYSRVGVDATDDPIHRLRYEAYLRDQAIGADFNGPLSDDLDRTPNAMSFGVHIDHELVSSIRLHYVSSAQPYGPSLTTTPDVIQPLLDRGQTFIDPSHFTADHKASIAYPALPFLTLRLAVMAAVHYRADWLLSLVRPEHTAFYRRVFQAEELSDVRVYPGLAFPVQLYGANVPATLAATLRRYPFFMSTPEERSDLFSTIGSRLSGGATDAVDSETNAERHFLLSSDPINVDATADRFSITREALAQTLGLGRSALGRKDRATARKSQQRLRELLEIVSIVREWAGSDLAAMSWYRATPIPAFGGRTAEAVVKDGNGHLVREYLDHLAIGGYA
jgi:hypothetical protein